MFWLTDAYGPRLTGSPGFEQAGDWTVKTLKDWGLQNVRKERFPFGKGWSLEKFHATMTAPQVMPIIGLPKAWTPGTNGLVTADVVRPQIARTPPKRRSTRASCAARSCSRSRLARCGCSTSASCSG